MTRGLTGASWALLVVHAVWFIAKGSEMHRFWGMRKKLKIHARSPLLAVLSGFTTVFLQLVIMLQEVLAQEDKVLPCVVVLYSNAVCISFYALPYLLRGLRIVVISDGVWRTKYMALLSRRNIFIIMWSVFVAMVGVCVGLQGAAPQVYGPNPTELCFFMGDWWFWGPTCGLCAAGSSRLFIELARVQHRVNMSKEISVAAAAWSVMSIPYFSLIILNAFDQVKVPRQHNFFFGFCLFLTDVVTFFLEPRRQKRAKSIFKWRRNSVVIIIDDNNSAKWRERWHNSKVIMSCPTMDTAFEKHVQDFLCSESYDFLKAVEGYTQRAETDSDEEYFSRFRLIVDLYILAGSELEVNIETAMRNEVLKIGTRKAFMAADADVKRDIFDPSEAEIRKMLDENLMRTFLTSVVFLNACKQVDEEEAAAEISLSVEQGTARAMSSGRYVEGEMTMAQAAVLMESMGSSDSSGPSALSRLATSLGRRGSSLGRRVSLVVLSGIGVDGSPFANRDEV